MRLLLNRLNRFLGADLFSRIGFDVYVDWVIGNVYSDECYVPEDADPVPYMQVIQQFRALGPECHSHALQEYKEWATFFDTLDGEPQEALFAEVVVGVMYECLSAKKSSLQVFS